MSSVWSRVAAKPVAYLVSALLICLVAGTNVSAGPANPTPFFLVQPNGAQFTARLVGDEWGNDYQTIDGYTILNDPRDGYWKYADIGQAGMALVLTSYVVGRDAVPLRLRKGLRSPPSLGLTQRSLRMQTAAASLPAASVALGSRRTLVILAQFNDKSGITTAASWQGRVFGATNSVKHHYLVSSYNQMTLTAATETHGAVNDGIVGWVTLNSNHPNTGRNVGQANEQLTKDAIAAANPYVNFAGYDTNGDGRISPSELMIIVIVAGSEAGFGGGTPCSPSVWGHMWFIDQVPAPVVDGVTAGGDGYAQFGEMHCHTSNLPGQPATIGVIAHELGHLFGLPDLYDTDQDDSGQGVSQGVGAWSLMAHGVWNQVTRPGDSPALLDAWSKAVLGWVTPTLVGGTLPSQSIPAAETSGTVYQFLRGSPGGTGEYFLVENRQRTSYDVALPGAGLLIWHVDEAQTSNDNECVPGGSPLCTSSNHYRVALVQADNAFDLERNANLGDDGDPFPGRFNNRTWSPFTAPDSNLWDGSSSHAVVTDISDSSTSMTATLSARGIRLVSPNGGETWTVGSPHSVTWTESGLNPSGQVYIILSLDGGQSDYPNPVAILAPGTKTYSWTPVSAQVTSAARLFVGNLVNGAYEFADSSDQNFTIVAQPSPAIANISPTAASVGTFSLTVNGSGFEPATAQIVVTGPGCATNAACVVPNGVLTTKNTNRIVGPLTISNAGAFTIRIQNGSGGPLSNGATLTVGGTTTAPTVVSGAASSITQTSALVTATVNPNGASTTLYFDYGTSTSYGNVATYGFVGSGTTNVTQSLSLSNLSCGTTYQYRARAQNSSGTNTGVNQTFTTSTCPNPSASELLTNGSFASGGTGWVLSGAFFADSRFSTCRSCPGYAYVSNSDGTAGNNLVGILYQTVTIPANATSAGLSFWYSITTQETSSSTAFDVLNVTVQNTSGGFLGTIAVLSNLSRTTGYVQHAADLMPYAGQTIRLNFLATTDSSLPTVFRIDDASILVTSATVAPTVVTGTPTSITLTNATVSATVNPNGASTTLYFDYGTTIGYGNIATYGIVGSGTSNVTLSHTLSNLSCGTTYAYRARAQNSGGTNTGSNQTFTTVPCPGPGAFNKAGPGNGALVEPTGVTLTWQPSVGAAVYQICFDRVNNGICDDQWYSTGLTMEILNLNAGATYYWQVRAQNANGITEADGGTWWSFNTRAWPPGTYFQDDGESGPGAWSAQPPWALTTEWAHSGTHAWSDSPGGQYGANLNASLFMPAIDISAASAPQLRFWHRRELASDGSDAANVWVTTDGGQTYSFLGGFSGLDLNWTESAFDLTPYVGLPSVRLVFQVFSNGASSGDGWYIDDVSVREATAPGPFGKTTPVNGSIQPGNLSLSWTASSGATAYEVCIGDSIDNNVCDGVWLNANGTDASIGISPGIYWWQARAVNAAGVTEADAGAWWSFRVLDPMPGPFSKTSPSNGSLQSTSAALTWSGSANSTSYAYCVDTINNNSCDAGWIATFGVSAALSGLAPNTTYWWQVRALNSEFDVDADAGVWWSFTTRPSGIYFEDNLEGFAPGWTLQSPWVVSQEYAHSGAWSLSDSFGGSYAPNRNTSATTPPIDLASATAPQLRFWHRREFAPDGIDSGNIWVTLDSGQTYTFLQKYTGRDETGQEAAVDLTAYVGLSGVRLVFQVFSNAAAEGDGWHIDDVVVAEAQDLAPFTKIAPSQGMTQLTTPVLSWAAVTGATSYEYCVDTTNNSACDTNWMTTSMTSAGPTALNPGTAYWWQVRARNAANVTEANAGIWWTFVTRAVPTGRHGDLDGNHTPDLILQNEVTRQALVLYMGGTGGGTIQGVNWLLQAGLTGWTISGVADMNGDGVADVLLQHDLTRQVAVLYLSGAQGNVIQGAALIVPVNLPGWTVSGAADFNSDGSQDLILQNDATRQVLVLYLGGTGGATIVSADWLSIAGFPGHRVVGSGDFNGDGKPDLLWQNDATRQVIVWTMAGSAGTLLHGASEVLPPGSLAGWTVVGAADMNHDGSPDVVAQNDATRQVTVWYLNGASLVGQGSLVPFNLPGWRAIVR